jgi:hypothetical protein
MVEAAQGFFQQERRFHDFSQCACPKLAFYLMSSLDGSLLSSFLLKSAGFGALQTAFLDIKEDSQKGRFVCARRAFRQGEIIFSQEPYAYAISTDLIHICHKCLKNPTKTMRCGTCKIARYCSPLCQKSDWSTHKLECSQLKRIAPCKDPTMAVFCMRVLNRFFQEFTDYSNHIADYKPSKTSDDFGDILRMCQPTIDIDPEGEDSYAIFMSRVLGTAAPIDLTLLSNVLLRTLPNSFSWSDCYNDDVGRLCFPSASLFNHSCLPNAWAYTDDKSPSIRIIAIRDIDPGEEICISYLNGGASVEKNRQTLSKQFGFSCQCDQCSLLKDTDSLNLNPTEPCLDCQWLELREKEWVSSSLDHLGPLISQLETRLNDCFPYDPNAHSINHAISILGLLQEYHLKARNWKSAFSIGGDLLSMYTLLKIPSFYPLASAARLKMGLLALRLRDWANASSNLKLALLGLKLSRNPLVRETEITLDLANNPQHFVLISAQLVSLPSISGFLEETLAELQDALLSEPKLFKLI